MALHRTGDKPLSEPMMSWFGDAYMRLFALSEFLFAADVKQMLGFNVIRGIDPFYGYKRYPFLVNQKTRFIHTHNVYYQVFDEASCSVIINSLLRYCGLVQHVWVGIQLKHVCGHRGPLFYPILAFAYCLCLRLSVRVFVCLCVNPKFVRAITHHPFQIWSSNLDQRCKTPWWGSPLFWGAIDLGRQGQN